MRITKAEVLNDSLVRIEAEHDDVGRVPGANEVYHFYVVHSGRTSPGHELLVIDGPEVAALISALAPTLAPA